MAENRAGSALPFFLGGAAIGVILGVLFAPKEGRETRRELKDWLKDKREETKELLARAREIIPEKREQLSAALKAGQEAYREARPHSNGHRREPQHV